MLETVGGADWEFTGVSIGGGQNEAQRGQSGEEEASVVDFDRDGEE